MHRGLVIAAVFLCAIPLNVAYAQQEGAPTFLRMALVDTKSKFSASADPVANAANIQTNINNIKTWVDRATAQGAEFVGFPELSINGCLYSSTMTFLSMNGPEVQQIRNKAVEKGIYICAGMDEIDAQNNKWNTQFVINPQGQIAGWHHKTWLTEDAPYVQTGTDHNVFDVKGAKMGIIICADGTDYYNLKALVDNGAQIIYGGHANTTGGTIQGWYNFRAAWAGTWDGTWTNRTTNNNGPPAPMPTVGYIDQLSGYAGRDIYAAIHNNAAWYSPAAGDPATRTWAAAAWFIGPDGATVPNNAQTQVYGFASAATTPNPTGLAVAQEPANTPPDANGHTTYEYMLIATLPIIPEPATIGFLLITATAILRRRT